MNSKIAFLRCRDNYFYNVLVWFVSEWSSIRQIRPWLRWTFFDGWRERVKAVQSHLFKCIHCLLWVDVITGVLRTCSCQCWTVMCVWWLWHLLSTMLDGCCWAPLPPQARKTDWALKLHTWTCILMATMLIRITIDLICICFSLSPFCPLSIYREISPTAGQPFSFVMEKVFSLMCYILCRKLCVASPLRLIIIQCIKTRSYNSARGLHPTKVLIRHCNL